MKYERIFLLYNERVFFMQVNILENSFQIFTGGDEVSYLYIIKLRAIT